MSDPRFPSQVLRRFTETTALELGAEQFSTILALSQLPGEWAQPQTLLRMAPEDSAKAYASLQAAMRTYFGRGARGILLRVGQRMWGPLLEDAGLASRAQAAVIRRLPQNLRRKPALELLSRLLGAQTGDITVHTMDLDLLLVDHTSPGAGDSRDASPICFVTQGLVRESLLWATSGGHDVEEISCKARGNKDCEFKIITGR